jgi:hypothetical protein
MLINSGGTEKSNPLFCSDIFWKLTSGSVENDGSNIKKHYVIIW